MSVLIIAQDEEPHTQAVVRHIRNEGGQAVVLDLSRFPEAADLGVRYTCCGDRLFTFKVDGQVHELLSFGAAWWRRPQPPLVSSRVADSTHHHFAMNECSEALNGLWHALDAFWVNEPSRDYVAHRKLTQLRVAQDCGFRLPDTLVTNDPDQAKLFIDRRGYRNVIYKSFSALEDAWRETRLLRESELELLENVRHAPVIFQEYVEAQYDLRITIVGDKIFPAAIHSQQTSYPVDFRMDMKNARIEAVTIPAELGTRLLALLSRLGLQYGAVDMRLRPDGQYVFLEINPAGQWLFVEEVTGQPIASALAVLLLEQDTAFQARRKGNSNRSLFNDREDPGARPC